MMPRQFKCKICKTKFESLSVTSKYCSVKCRKIQSKTRNLNRIKSK